MESALESYFDNFIANDSSKMEMQEVNEELFLSLLPDELHTDSSTNLDSISQNSTAAVSPVCPVSSMMSVTQQPEIFPQIENVISTVKLGCCLDLNLIACKAWNVEYRPKTYKALIMRIREPRTTAMIYKSGNIVCTGAKSKEQSRLAARKYVHILRKLGFPVHFLRFEIHHLVASCKIFPVSLEKLAHYHPCSYEPELFPGLFHTVMPGITITVFPSGMTSLSGAKTEAEVYEAYRIILPVLSCFRRQR